jgi:2-polyprenyl-6-methoxyphenol hydroxylase-like FAD-dependent oxidoreductase
VTTWTVLLGREVTFLAVPIGRGQVYCYCDTPVRGCEAPQATSTVGRLAELLTGFASPVPAILDTFGSDGTMHVAPIEEVRLDAWSRGSVLLIGDAAHAASPNMAEGAAMALEDGLILAECLADSGGVAQAVARFQARRRPRAQWVLAQTHRRDRTRKPATRRSQPRATHVGSPHLPRQLSPAPRTSLTHGPVHVRTGGQQPGGDVTRSPRSVNTPRAWCLACSTNSSS